MQNPASPQHRAREHAVELRRDARQLFRLRYFWPGAGRRSAYLFDRANAIESVIHRLQDAETRLGSLLTQAQELQACRDHNSHQSILLDMIAGYLLVPMEPHQTYEDRLLQRARLAGLALDIALDRATRPDNATEEDSDA